MSRSRRKTPIIKIAGDSDKPMKKIANRSLRRVAKSLIQGGQYELLPLQREASNT